MTSITCGQLPCKLVNENDYHRNRIETKERTTDLQVPENDLYVQVTPPACRWPHYDNSISNQTKMRRRTGVGPTKTPQTNDQLCDVARPKRSRSSRTWCVGNERVQTAVDIGRIRFTSATRLHENRINREQQGDE
jgi:hypothetical protein